MSFKNPIHESIFNTIIKPTLEKRKLSVQGRIMSMEKQDYAEVYWREPSSGTEMISKNVPLPHVGGGLFSEEMQPGDYVVLEFRNGNYKHPFISAVHGVEAWIFKRVRQIRVQTPKRAKKTWLRMEQKYQKVKAWNRRFAYE